jgi:CDP-4-dehydro-6-deoxyglucose reductase, E3
MRIRFEGREFEGPDGETVLECLERQGVALPSFCRNGACQTCVMKAEAGEVPAASQQGLKPAWKRQGLFLACVCRPAATLDVARCDAARQFPTRVLEVEPLNAQVLRVLLARPAEFEFNAGQFVQLVRPGDGLMRPYSIASLPNSPVIELHVALMPDGQMSQWLRNAMHEPMELRGPFGECSYWPDEPDRPLLLAGTGTGLAPLLGVLRAALAAGHCAPIRLFHGASRVEGLYLWDLLQTLQSAHALLTVSGSVLEGADVERRVSDVPLDQQVLALGDAMLAPQRVYLCGRPEFVREMRREIYLSGVPFERIHADPFLEPARNRSRA